MRRQKKNQEVKRCTNRLAVKDVKDLSDMMISVLLNLIAIKIGNLPIVKPIKRQNK